LPAARQLYQVAAAHGIDWAERDYAEMLEFGAGGAADLALALHYYQRAAGQGYAMAGMDIAEMAWANPQAFPDQVHALAWCLWAEAQPATWDGTDYEGACAEAAARLTPDEQADAATRAANF
jgi:TPR repeat protein